ncbi:MAG TPA: MFS transporter [Chlamydiales bacterium]|nr:MFS transporter [Chlamydiales bacterium]
MRKKKLTLFSVYLTFFVDNLSWAIVFPIFAPYFLDPENPLFSPALSNATRMMLLGFFLTAFSLGQFLGAPVIGEYADRHGRKKALAVGVSFTLAGLILTAWSMQIGNLYLLFVGRLITGIFAGSTSVCLSCITDLSDSETSKMKNFGYLSMIAGVSFVFGAFVGGKLSDRTISASFTADLPIWLASGLTFVNLLFIFFGFRETSVVHPSVKFHFLEAFSHIKVALRTENIKRVYAIYFLFLFAWTIIFQFISVLTVEKFSFTNSNIGDMALFMGVCWALGSGYINKILIHRFHSLNVLEFCLVGFTILCGLIVVPDQIYGVMLILGLCVILGGIAWPLCTSLISNTAPQQMQGKILGMSQSIQSFAMTTAPLVGGLAFRVSLGLPFLIAAAICLSAALIYYFTLKSR